MSDPVRRRPIPRAARLDDDADWLEAPADLSAIGRPGKRFSWLGPRTLWHSRNNVLASLLGDPTENARRSWVAAQRQLLVDRGEPTSVSEDFEIAREDLDDYSFMVIGDTGEGDWSQYSVVPAFLNAAAGTEFTVIASDVLYPAGDINEYVEKFFVPYAGYPRPIYAIPGNHDWLDGLVGFMRHFCGAPTPADKFRPPRRAKWARLGLIAHRVLWRRPRDLSPGTLEAAEDLRGHVGDGRPPQPNMYFHIDTPKLRIIAIDTGILGRLDHDQGEWLRRVSAGPKPKLLISGKPIYSGETFSPRRILAPEGTEEGQTGLLWNLLRDPANNYVGMVAGDVHHYERHEVKLPDGRTMQCVISGGGGAFTTSTHQIPRVSVGDVGERDWIVYPTRADSMRAYSIVLQRKLMPWRRGRVRGIPADEATAVLARRHGLDLGAELARGERPGPAEGSIRVSRRTRLLSWILFPPEHLQWFSPSKVSEALDWDYPPLFKNFVRMEVRGDELTMTAYGVTGLARDAEAPAVIDQFSVQLREGDSDDER